MLEARADDRSARLSFDDSDEGERLRRYQIACGRSLNRGLDTLLKLRKAEEKRHAELIPTDPPGSEASLPIDEPHTCCLIETPRRSSPAEANPPEPITVMIPAAQSDPANADPSMVVGWVKPTNGTAQDGGFHPPYKTELGPSETDIPSPPDSNGSPDPALTPATTEDRITRNEPTPPPSERTTSESATSDDEGNARNEPISSAEEDESEEAQPRTSARFLRCRSSRRPRRPWRFQSDIPQRSLPQVCQPRKKEGEPKPTGLPMTLG